MTTYAGDGPSGASGDAVHEPAEVGDGGWGAARHAQHEVELHGSARGLTLLGHVEDGVEVTHLEALVFGLDAAFLHHPGNLVDAQGNAVRVVSPEGEVLREGTSDVTVTADYYEAACDLSGQGAVGQWSDYAVEF